MGKEVMLDHRGGCTVRVPKLYPRIANQETPGEEEVWMQFSTGAKAGLHCPGSLSPPRWPSGGGFTGAPR